MKIAFYLPSFDGRPNQKLFNKGWIVSYGVDIFGIHFIKYANYR